MWKEITKTNLVEHVKHKTIMSNMHSWYVTKETKDKIVGAFKGLYHSYQYDDGVIQMQMCWQFKENLNKWKLCRWGVVGGKKEQIASIFMKKTVEFLKLKNVNIFYCHVIDYEKQWIKDIVKYWEDNYLHDIVKTPIGKCEYWEVNISNPTKSALKAIML